MLTVWSLLAGTLLAPEDPWLEYIVPRPREIAVQDVLVVAPDRLTIVVPEGAPKLLRSAAEELAATMAAAGGAPTLAPRAADGPALVLALAGELGDLAAGLDLPDWQAIPNADQAYAIRPLPTGGLLLTGPTPLAVRYAALTLRQMVAARLTPGRVSLPILTVTDWPAIAERGFWGGDASADLSWLAERKINLLELHATLGFAEDGTPTATMNEAVLAEAERLGVTVVPIIHHIEQLERTGIFARYPELDGGRSEKNPQLHFLRLDHPKLREIMGKWFSDLAAYPTVQAITVWLSEDSGAHKLADPNENTFVAEVKLMQAALDTARRVKPALRLRLLTTQASYASNDLVIAAARPDEAIIHYHGSRTYNSSRQPILDQNLRDFSARGGWLGVCPQVIPDWRGVAPWHGGGFVRARMREFVDAGVRILVAYAPSGRRYNPYMVEATAEWSWNPEGRDPETFAPGYAVRHGLTDPDTFGEYVNLVDPVGWDVYGSRVIVIWCYGSSIPLVAEGKLQLGQSVLAEFKDEARFEQDRLACEQARDLAIRLGDPQLVREAVVLGGWARLLELQYRLSGLLPKAENLTDAQRADVGAWLAEYDRVTTSTVEALEAWGEAVAAETGGKPPGRFTDTVNAILDEATALAALGEQHGFPDTRKAYRRVQVGDWKTEDFDRDGTITAVFDVTDRIDGAGRYEVEFAYRGGQLGLVGHRVALVAQTGDDAATRQEISVDEHRSHCGAWNDGHLYRIELKDYDPARRYLVLATISGGNPATPRDARSTNGVVLFRKLDAGP